MLLAYFASHMMTIRFYSRVPEVLKSGQVIKDSLMHDRVQGKLSDTTNLPRDCAWEVSENNNRRISTPICDYIGSQLL